MRPRLWPPSVQNPRHRPQGEQRAWVWAVRGGGKKQPGFRGVAAQHTRDTVLCLSRQQNLPAARPHPPVPWFLWCRRWV